MELAQIHAKASQARNLLAEVSTSIDNLFAADVSARADHFAEVSELALKAFAEAHRLNFRLARLLRCSK